ncbi:ANK [Seminavis robusta]|uniref:ANK n=1 Tax=Seminavis robusta TaxID=568900 RepID=A0A9N8DDB7_9STRA|nr:ANK [Seminavis robusta]|eukprot:Sro71_g039400.1 ANK (357) ;mRNA; f:71637-72806
MAPATEPEEESEDETSDDSSKDTAGSGSVISDATDTDVDDSSASYSTCSTGTDSSLGNLIASMGGIAGMGKDTKDTKTMAKTVQAGKLKRRLSTPNMMQMQLEVAPSTIENNEHRDALLRFLDRMNNTESYFQDPNTDGDDNVSGRRKVSSTGALEDLRKNTVDRDNPSHYFKAMVEGDLPKQNRTLFTDKYWENYFTPITQARRNAYKGNVVKAIRDQDLETLKKILTTEGDASMEACNAQGETLLHLACRRRNHELVKFLVITAHVSIKVRDDYHKTPLHEVCWYTEPRNPSQFHSVEFLMVLAPELFFAKDKRGFTPLQYAPKSSWKGWCRFLARNKESIRSKVRNMDFGGGF